MLSINNSVFQNIVSVTSGWSKEKLQIQFHPLTAGNPGQCPEPDLITPDPFADNLCWNDDNCDRTQKCCPTSDGGRQCMPAEFDLDSTCFYLLVTKNNNRFGMFCCSIKRVFLHFTLLCFQFAEKLWTCAWHSHLHEGFRFQTIFPIRWIQRIMNTRRLFREETNAKVWDVILMMLWCLSVGVITRIRRTR